MTELRELLLPDGRTLEMSGMDSPGAPVLMYLHGTPGAGRPYDHVVGPARQRGLRLVSFSRAGYARSSPRPGRSVADVVEDAVAVLDAIGVERALVAGVSGGGPHALACAALRPDRFVAALVVAGCAPYDADLDFLDGMGQANLDEYGAALAGEASLRQFLDELAPTMRTGTAADLIDAWHTMLPEVDQAMLSGALGEDFMAGIHHALSGTVEGWLEDDMAFIGAWGFDPAATSVPVSIWHGGRDQLVPFTHGQWLADHIPGARVHLYPDEGHLSIRIGHLGDMLDELLELGTAAVG